MSDSPLLIAKHIAFAYGDNRVLREIDLSLTPGRLSALLGPNGSGKSTLIRCLLGQLPASGEVHWNGRLVKAYSHRELAKQVAYLPQSATHDPEQRVIDYLRLGRTPYLSALGLESPQDLKVVQQIATMLDLSLLLHRSLHALSGGQRQRVFLGRCLIQQPKALLLDEPATYLDLRYQVELLQMLKKLCTEHSLAILMASHDLNLAGAFADEVVLLNQGTVVAAGPPETTLLPETVSSVYGISLDAVNGPSGNKLLFPKLR